MRRHVAILRAKIYHREIGGSKDKEGYEQCWPRRSQQYCLAGEEGSSQTDVLEEAVGRHAFAFQA